MPLGLQEGGFIGPLQTDELGQGRGVADFQSQSRIGGVVAFLPAGVVIVVASQREAAKNALDLDGLPPLADLTGLGVVGRIDAVGGLLEQPADQAVGRLEHGGAHQQLQLRDAISFWGLGLKAGYQFLDFLLLGEDELGRQLFFFIPAVAWRVSATTKSAYCSVNCWYWA